MMCPCSSAEERLAVNQRVEGSTPSRDFITEQCMSITNGLDETGSAQDIDYQILNGIY